MASFAVRAGANFDLGGLTGETDSRSMQNSDVVFATSNRAMCDHSH